MATPVSIIEFLPAQPFPFDIPREHPIFDRLQPITDRLKTQRSDRWQNLPDRRRVQGFPQLPPFPAEPSDRQSIAR
jgi:hypothetical protein